MKRLFFVLSILWILFSCNQSTNKPSGNSVEKDILVGENSEMLLETKYTQKNDLSDVKNIISYDTERIDTLIQDFRIKYEIFSNGNYVEKQTVIETEEEWYHEDRSLIISIWKGDKLILDKRRIDKKDFISFIDPDIMRIFHIINFRIQDIAPNGIRFSSNFCQPDTDWCYVMVLFIDDKGNISYNVLEDDMDEEE